MGQPGGRPPVTAFDRLADRLEGVAPDVPVVLHGDDERAQVSGLIGDLMAPYMDAGMTRVQALTQVLADREKSPRL